MKRYIASNARPRAEIEDKLEEKTMELLQHLAYLYVFRDCRDDSHWKFEVWNLFHKMSKIRIGRKVRYLTPEEFLDATYNQHNSDHTFQYLIEAAVELKSQYQPARTDTFEFKAICSEYFKWLASNICKSGEVIPSECYSKLSELDL